VRRATPMRNYLEDNLIYSVSSYAQDSSQMHIITMNIYRPLRTSISQAVKYLPRSIACHPEPRRHNIQAQRAFQYSPRRYISPSNENSPASEAEKVLYQGPESSESKLFALGSSLATRLSVDRTLQCTEFDDKGNIVAGNVEIKKSDLVTKASFELLNCY